MLFSYSEVDLIVKPRRDQADLDSPLEFLQQRLRLPQVRRIKSLGEPLVPRGEQVVGILALFLGLPQASQAGGGAQFPGFGLLLAGKQQGMVKDTCRLRLETYAFETGRTNTA
ncbi:MAG: hypothetical protein O7G88_16830 [bacterium]|nr:hypothetical protein [bacterium]